MQRLAVVAASVLLSGLVLTVPSVQAEWGVKGPRRVGGAVSGATLVPFVAVGSPRSRPAAGYVSVAWLPGSPLGALGLGYEAALRGGIRLYGEAGVVGAIGEGALPYGHLGVRLRF